MHNYKLFLSVVLLQLSLSLFASPAPLVGKVIALKGEVSILRPRKMEAEMLKIGDSVQEDSSILSKEKSFARISLTDGSVVTLGPNSKIVVELVKKDSASVVALMMGTMRAQVKKSIDAENQKKEKFIINTRVAAMGVRGTDFQASFSPKSLRSSIVTYDGNVAIKKISPEKRLSIYQAEAASKVSQMQEMFREAKVEVKMGDFTNVTFKSVEAEAPVKINPSQFVLLKKDQSLGVEPQKINKKELNQEVKQVTEAFNQSISDPSTINKNFGVIDIKTGLYIPAEEGGKKVVGQINTNGQYIAPKGIVLDEVKGFIAKNSEDKAALKQVKKLNEKLDAQIVDVDDPSFGRYFDL